MYSIVKLFVEDKLKDLMDIKEEYLNNNKRVVVSSMV